MLNSNFDELSPRDQIKAVARKLLKEGTRPSQNNVKEHLTKASSNTTISKALDEFWIELSEELEANDTRPGIPDELFHMLQDIWSVSLKAAKESAEERMQRALDIEARALDSNAELKQQLASLQKKFDALSVDQEKTASLLEKEKASSAELGALLVKAQENVKDLQGQLQSTIQRNDDFRESSDNRLDNLMVEYDRLRTNFDEKESELKSRLDASSEDLRRCETSLSAARHAVTNLEKFQDLYKHEQEQSKLLREQQEKVRTANNELTGRLEGMIDRMEEQRTRYVDQERELREAHSSEVATLKDSELKHLNKIDELTNQVTELEAECKAKPRS